MATSAATIFILLSTYAILVSSKSPAPSPGIGSPAPSPVVGLECGDTTSLMSCLDYVTPGSNATVPPTDCCTGVASMLKSGPAECLCSALKEAVSMGFSLNMTRAVGLPVSCGLPAPKDQCDVSGPPTPAPAPVVPTPVVPTPVPSLPPKSGSAPSSPPAEVPTTPVVPKPGVPVPPTVTTGTPAPAPMMSMARGLSYSPVMVLVGLAVALVA